MNINIGYTFIEPDSNSPYKVTKIVADYCETLPINPPKTHGGMPIVSTKIFSPEKIATFQPLTIQ